MHPRIAGWPASAGAAPELHRACQALRVLRPGAGGADAARALVGGGAAGTRRMARRKVIIDVDTGHDDAVRNRHAGQRPHRCSCCLFAADGFSRLLRAYR